MHFRAGDRVYADESKARGYYVAAAASPMSTTTATAKALRGLLLPRQRRIHFKGERDARRRQLLAAMCEMDVRVTVLVAADRADKVARPECLQRLVGEMLQAKASHLVLERDDSLEAADRAVIASAMRDSNARLEYRHAAPYEEPILWVSDAVAWSYAKRGEWVDRCDRLVGNRVIRL